MEQCPRDYYGQGTYVRFENLSVRVPELYDEYLNHKYHDYMKLLPEEKRKPHHGCIAFDPGIYGK